MEEKNFEFRSPEGERCQQIGRYHQACRMVHQGVVVKEYASMMCHNHVTESKSASMCILRIAREGPWNPPNCILVRGKALWRPSFDILTEGMERQK